MNIIRNIEGASLLAIGAFCAAAVANIVLHSAHVYPASQTIVTASANVIELPPVIVTGKRMQPAA